MATTRGIVDGARRPAFAAALLVTLAACAQREPPPGRPAGDGSIPENSSISLSDTDHDALRGLDPALLEAVRKADVDARLAGVELRVTSGWRSEAYQRRLLDQAVVTYGSLQEARRFVSTPEKSKHVVGKAIDIGPTNADDWLIRHGAAYGLCQAYANEMWHFELLTTPGGECPQPLADATS
ncbi:M15 family metallopeptidase [Umezawaea endophytica]|uniref:M15 family metallopeptidase n=1 Tax=Umezawaea endophytica TaxID=1654476 RepID=A0A9X2VHU0_9PSEU|nr:M15 family metallopeptidase [Umezawaea endophytica]MCS7475283.1 M15 family metallopeptidase [Umezawaea endophytica]